MCRQWDGVVVAGVRGQTFTENGPFTAVAGRIPVVGRVPSGPLGGRTGTAGPADCGFNVIMR